MPYRNTSGGDSEDFYADTPPTTSTTKADSGRETGEEMETTLIPKSLAPNKDFQPGDEITLRVVRVHEGDLEVAYGDEAASEEERTDRDETPAPPTAADGGMASMME